MIVLRRPVHFLSVALALLLVQNGVAAEPFLIGPSADTTPVEPATDAPTPPENKRAENAAHLQVALRKLESTGAADSATAQEIAHYQTRDAVLAQLDAVEQQIKDLEARKAELDGQLKAPTPTGENAACSFVELDGFKDELAADEARLNLVADKVAATKAAVEKAQNAHAESESKQRTTQQALEAGKGAPNVAELARAADHAKQAAILATDTLALRKREQDRERLALEVQHLVVQYRKQQVDRLSPLVVASEADYQQQINDIKDKEDAANKWLLRTQIRLQTASIKLREAQQALDAGIGDRLLLTEQLEAQRRTKEKLADEIDCLTQRLQRLAQLRLAWNHRFETAAIDGDKADREAWAKLKSLQKETKGVLDELAADLRMEILRMRDLRSSLTGVSKKAEEAANAPAELRAALESQQYQLELTLRIHERNLVMIETSRRVHEKLLEEIAQRVEVLSPKTIALGAWYQADLIWNYELGHVEKEPITVGNGVTGLIIFASGWMLSRFLAAVFAHRLLKRFRLSKDGTAAIRTLVYYTLLTIVVLWSLKTVNVPLTAFTILGGALAIGVGFGSQALINNFIGGLIMLAERPVRLGERITFGSIDGVVEDVGFRCTKLRTQNDHLVTIPNSTLVNESIENVDRRRTIRRVMNIQVTYNVNRELLQAAVKAIRDILEEKEIRERIHPIVGFEEFPPRVHFTDYATESLTIQATYWYAPVDSWAYMEHCERVNYRIMEEFERLGVDFAFPSKTAYVKKPNQRGGASFAA
jgi:small-conductance mechanosensitive channel